MALRGLFSFPSEADGSIGNTGYQYPNTKWSIQSVALFYRNFKSGATERPPEGIFLTALIDQLEANGRSRLLGTLILRGQTIEIIDTDPQTPKPQQHSEPGFHLFVREVNAKNEHRK